MGSTAQRMICERYYPLKSLRKMAAVRRQESAMGGWVRRLEMVHWLCMQLVRARARSVSSGTKMSCFHKENVFVSVISKFLILKYESST